MADEGVPPDQEPSSSTDEVGSKSPDTSNGTAVTSAMLAKLAAIGKSAAGVDMQALAQQLKNLAPNEHNFQFWNTQPVPKIDEIVTDNTFINPPVPVSQIQQAPYPLPGGFHWTDVDLTSSDDLNELYKLLSENYVEDDDNMFRFAYAPEFLQWVLMPPGWLKSWHCGVRAGNNNKLVAFIGAIPCTISIHGKIVKGVEINFLCVHKKLRSKRVAPVLIREITRRVNLQGIFQATFTAGIVIPKPIARCQYYHRTINAKKLIETGFSSLAPNMNLSRTNKLFRLPDKTTLRLVPLAKKHVDSAFKLITGYLTRFKLHQKFTKHEFEHFFLPRAGVVFTWVAVDVHGKVTDLTSFYSLPSTVVQHATHDRINAAYAFYNVATTTSLVALMKDSLILAKQNNFDVYNALDVMENAQYLTDLKFGRGDGMLQYYMYNWKCPDLSPSEVGFVLQ